MTMNVGRIERVPGGGEMWAWAKGRGSTLLALAALFGAVVLTTLTGGWAPAQEPADPATLSATPPAGSLVVALPELGRSISSA